MPTRAEHRESTLLALSNAAVVEFELSGSKATVDAIADRAGVARRTVFRYVDAKEELAFIHPVLWFDVFDAALETSAHEELVDVLFDASEAIAAHIDADPEPPRRAFHVVASEPDLAPGFNRIFQRWVDRVAAEVLARTESTETLDRFRSRVIGAAVMGMVDATTREWAFSGNGASFTELHTLGFETIRPLFEQR